MIVLNTFRTLSQSSEIDTIIIPIFGRNWSSEKWFNFLKIMQPVSGVHEIQLLSVLSQSCTLKLSNRLLQIYNIE